MPKLNQYAIVKTAIFFVLLVNSSPLFAQCTSTGTHNPSNVNSVAFAGSEFSFSSVAHALTSDNNRASASALLTLFNGETDYLQATGFGFAIPATAIICGVEVEIEKSATGIGTILGIGLSSVIDYSVRLVRGGTVEGHNKAKAGNWTGSETYHTYGGSGDLWGIGLMPADVNAAGFGVAISARIAGLAMLLPSVHIDHIRITVHYYEDVVLSKNLLDFRVTSTKNNTAVIEWKTAGDPAGRQQVQRSQDGMHWETVPGTAQASHGAIQTYQLTDYQPYAGASRYRLVTTAPSGAEIHSALRSIYIDNYVRTNVYPNPCTEYLVVSGIAPGERIVLRDTWGKTVATVPVRTGSNAYKIDVRRLPPGIYFVQAGKKATKVVKR